MREEPRDVTSVLFMKMLAEHACVYRGILQELRKAVSLQ